MMMYQLPIDMITRMPSVKRSTISPPLHTASSPYGLSTTSVALVAAFGAGAAAGSAAAAAVVGACVCANDGCGMTAADAATSRTAASAARRVVFNMESPDKVVQS